MIGAVLTALALQAWTGLTIPSKSAQSALVSAVAATVQPGDEVAYLPGWEQQWALSIARHLPDHTQRLGRDDLLRPFDRLWLFESADSPGPDFALQPGVRVLEEVVKGGLSVRLYEQQRALEPLAYPQLKKCRLTKAQRRCSDASGRIQTTELAFDGRFAWGQKITVKSDVMTLIFQGEPGATLIGGMGWTGHGVRHAKGGVSVQWQGSQASGHALASRAGLKPFRVVSNSQGQVQLKITLNNWKDGEFAVSSGWVK
jgi:hypothetical protein